MFSKKKEKKKFDLFEKDYVDNISLVMENHELLKRGHVFKKIYKKYKPKFFPSVLEPRTDDTIVLKYFEELIYKGDVSIGIITLDKNQFQYFIIYSDYRFDVLIDKKYVDQNLFIGVSTNLNLRSSIVHFNDIGYYKIEYQKRYFSYHPSGDELYISFMSLTKDEFIESVKNIYIISERHKFGKDHLQDVIQDYINKFCNELFLSTYELDIKKWMFFSVPNLFKDDSLIIGISELGLMKENFNITCFCKHKIFIV